LTPNIDIATNNSPITSTGWETAQRTPTPTHYGHMEDYWKDPIRIEGAAASYTQNTRQQNTHKSQDQHDDPTALQA
jgi:hypothetical protein